jgi:hypothetical protein
MNKNLLNTFFILCLSTVLLISCSKDTSGAEVDLSYKMLADKTWYLEYTQTINGTSINTKTYVGQSTYFINFLKDLTTHDSDGLSGSYTVQKNDDKLQIKVQAKISSGVESFYSYDVVTIGTKDMVLSYKNGAIITKFYYSTQK